jgi:hypothetical protein
LLGPAAAGAPDVAGALLVVADDDAADVCFEVDGADLVSDPQPDMPIPIAIAEMATTPARSARVIGSPVDFEISGVAYGRQTSSACETPRSVAVRDGKFSGSCAVGC